MAKKMNAVYGGDGAGLDKLKKQLGILEKNAVAVGIHEDAGEYEGGNGTTVAEAAVFNEYGTPTIPERSFMRSNLREKLKQYRIALAKIAKSAIDKPVTAKTNMGKLGQMAANDIQNKIVSLRTPPNAESTIAKKKTTNPLIDTGQLVNSIKWKYLNEKATKADD